MRSWRSRRGPRSWRSARPDSTTTGSKATSAGSASGSACTSAPRLRAGKPLVIHTRAARADTLALMREENARDAGGVMHCFTETWDVARAALDLGFHISLSGIVTFKNAHDVKDVARRVPLDRLLIETDAPYLAPVPFRGKRNQPAYVPHVAAEIARLRGMPPEEIAQATTANFFRLFRIDATRGRPCPLTGAAAMRAASLASLIVAARRVVAVAQRPRARADRCRKTS